MENLDPVLVAPLPEGFVQFAPNIDSPGLDGKWFTEDDKSGSHSHFERYWTLDLFEYFDIQFDDGPDYVPRTRDDVPQNRTHFYCDRNGLVIESINPHSPGVDGVWGTDDDDNFGGGEIVRQTTTYSEDGRRLPTEVHSPGIDHIPGNNDDVLYSWEEYDPSL